MKNTIRCCISCILPCGVLDVIRIVHSNGRVEEISGTIKAAEILKAYPKHVLKKPSTSSGEGCCPKIVIVPPDADLQRGKIYFLMPIPSAPEKSRSRRKKRADTQSSGGNGTNSRNNGSSNNKYNSTSAVSATDFLISDRYLTEILSEKVSTQRDRRRGRAGVWRPHLESICETTSEV
ncbi:hypothetical protein RHSIM_Rhsim13G0189800 [Rhododendron simsii]|uniref:Uncharacterized protein n=1 Tax=Rhododendron simsii TaxID=118357 RepID=A0A834L696_RHOSS|nr:hypothetical protein RHSIM_Rhsim13G0189800 [Rhododendron simsii]